MKSRGDGRMKPISKEKREIIIEARERGEKLETIAKWVKVSLSSVNSVLRQNRETGSIEPKPYKGRKPKISECAAKILDFYRYHRSIVTFLFCLFCVFMELDFVRMLCITDLNILQSYTQYKYCSIEMTLIPMLRIQT